MNVSFFFYLFAFVTLGFGLVVVSTKNPTYAVLSLVGSMFGLAAIYLLLQAYFVAIIHLLVYAGAVLVLFLFVVMLLGVDSEEESDTAQKMRRIFGGLVVFSFLFETGIVIKSISVSREVSPESLLGTIESVGRVLFSQYLLPFEITSVLLLVGIIGAVVLARKETV